MVVTRRQSAAPPPPAASRTNSSVGTARITPASSSKGKYVESALNDDDASLNSTSNRASPVKDVNNRAGPSRNTPANASASASSKASSVGPRRDDIKAEDDDIPEQNSLPSEPSPPPGKGGLSKAKPKSKAKKGSKNKKSRNEKSSKGISIFDILARMLLLWFTIYTVSVCPEDVQMRSPICRALTEYRRLVLEPYILPPIQMAMQNPFISSTVHSVEPIYSTAVKISTPVIRRTRQEWRMHVQPQIAWLRIRTRPYIRQFQRKYEATLGPYMDNLAYRYQLYVQPRINTTISTADKQWRAIRPYVRPIWKAVKRLPGVILRILFRLIINAKEKWVDPQIDKIWVAIMEQERASREGIPVVESVDVAEVIDVITSVGVTPAPTPTVSGESLVPEPPVVSSETIPSVPIPPTLDVTDEIAASIIKETLSPPATFEEDELVHITDSIPDFDSELAGLDIPAITDKAAASAASIMVESLSPTTEDVEESFAVADTPVYAVPENAEKEEEEDADLDALLDEFLDDISTNAEPAPPLTSESSTHEDVHEKEERLRQKKIQTEQQRADLERRHTKWEQDIEKLGREHRKDVKEALIRLREVAVADTQDSAGVIRKQVTDIVNEAEKSLKGLKAFSKKLLAQNEKEDEERMKEWNDVVAKVEKKLGARIDNFSQVVREWIGELLQAEIRELEIFASALIDLANQAQDDLGKGYTWLADVTYHDWERYHNLLRTAKSFGDVYHSLQNGTATDAPANSLNDALRSLQEEIDDIILGFEASIGQIRSTVLDKLVLADSGDVNGNSENVAETSEATLNLDLDPPSTESESEREPEMSILPIDVGKDTAVEDGHKIPLGVIRSRDAEEVRQALEGLVHEEL